MRSIHTIKSGNRAKKDYYTKDESLKQGEDQDKDQKAYYGKGKGKTQAVWYGKDAARLNLRGHAEQADFEQIYDGFIPGTQERIRGEKPREDHQENCLYDVVLSCKKSVSMQIHLGNDERLYEAYQETVLEIAHLVENDYAQARIQVNGDRRIVQTGGIIALMIPHHTSREMDMNVHTHLAIANGTYCEDGKWRSLLDRGFSHAYYMGDYFSARLAAKVQALGYEIRETVTEEGHPSWELAGYTDEQIKVFSKRSEDAKVKELVAAGMSRDDALMRTRKAKNAEETLEEAQDRWKVEADAFEIKAITPLERPVEPKLRATAEQVLQSAIRHYSNRSNHFTRDKIREYAFKLNRSFTVEDLDQAIASHTELIDYGKLRGVDELRGHFTTVQAVEREIRTIKAWMQGQGQAIPILEREAAAQALEAIQLKTGQRSAIIGVLASNNQHQIIHGLSGVGKTTALRQLKALTDLHSVEVLGFAPSIDAAKKLSGELGIQTHTVQSLVKKNFDLKPNQILIIDEAGMVSAEMMDVVMHKANAAGARVLLVGDTGQNQAIEAGSPMRSLMKHGAEVHHIAEIIRQQNTIQRQAVELIAKGNGLDALSLLNEHDYINPMPEREQRVSALAAEYLALSPDEQLNTLIVAGTNAEKDAITAEIRAGLKAEGRLGKSQTVIQLRDRALTPEEAKQIAYYRVGDYIKFSRNYKRISERDYERTWLQKNVPYQVVGKDGNELIVSTAGGRRFRVNPALMKDKQVFEGHEFDIAVGDSLRWTSSNRDKGQINGKTFKITALDGNVATILTDDGLRQLDLSEALAVDYTLTSTSYRAQGSDRPRVFVSATNDPTSNREPFYVSISRQIKELKVWTDNYEGLKRRVAESSVQSNPLELIGENYVSPEQRRERTESVRTDLGIFTGKSTDSGVLRVFERGDAGVSRSDLDGSRRAAEQTERGREQDASSDWKLGDNVRRGERDGKGDIGSPEVSYGLVDGEQPEARSTVAERLLEFAYRERLVQELREPLAELISTLEELREVGKLNSMLQAQITQRTELVINQAKVKVLDTALQEWQSLRSGAEPLQLSDQTITPSERVELSELLQNYPAQKAVQFAMEEYYQASEQVIDMKSTLKMGIPVFRVDNLSEFRNEPNEDTMPTKTVEPPRRKPQTPQPTSKPTKRQPKAKTENPTFWQPLYPARVPNNIEPHHWNEFKRSAIHPDLITLNAESVSGQEVYERLLSERLAKLGTGQYVTQPMARLMAQYEQVAEGGWWGKAGIDAKSLLNLQPGQPPQLSTWGCFKADNPRLDQGKTERKGQDEYIKYENPLGVSRSLYLPLVPDAHANRIYKKHGIQPSTAEKRSGFWYVVRQYNLPITITEGAKKTWASLSQGEVTIGVSGVNGLYRAKDQDGKLLPERLLNEQMAVFATPGREFKFAYDQDIKATTVRTVRRDRVRGIELLEAEGCTCKVVSWKPEEGKGLDDLIINRGPLAYAQAIATAQPAEREKQIHYRTEFNAIARQVRNTQPDITHEALDVEVYLRAVAKAEPKDGDRFISQGDHARSLKDSALVQKYVEHIKTIAPQYHQRLREQAEAQAAAQAQQAQDRSEYQGLALEVTRALGNIPTEQLDTEVYLRAIYQGKDAKPILTQSDYARSLDTPEQKTDYVQRIEAGAPQYRHRQAQAEQRAAEQVAEQAKAQAIAQVVAEAERMAQEAQAADQKAQEDAQAIAQQQLVNDRAAYGKLLQQVKNQLVDIPAKHFDAVVYKWAQAKGLDGDRILAQSDLVQSFKHHGERSGYIRNIKRLANRIDIAPGADVSNTQRQLNERALKSGTWFTQHYGKKQDDGWTVFEGDRFTYYAKDEEFKIYSPLERRNVLELKDNRLISRVSPQDVVSLESAVEKGKKMIVKDYRQREAQEIKRIQSKKKGRGRSPSG